MLLTTVSLAVSAVPEGLPAVVTVAMAVGVAAVGAQVLVRRLSTVEDVGAPRSSAPTRPARSTGGPCASSG
ncbi:MAG: hypothetical protein U0168_01510 [Nannocystaceae bacterium]